MIICSCNVISDREIRSCVKPCGASAEKARDVFRSLGRAPKCGRCVRNIQSIFERAERQETTQLEMAQAAE